MLPPPHPISPHTPTGLVSVSFRKLDPDSIIDLARLNNLQMIEWGSDIHVPVGDLAHAREVGRRTREAGLGVTAYGSYYRLGDPTPPDSFEQILDTAVALEAPVIRVWAGNVGSEEADEALWECLCHDAERVATLASEVGARVALEFHGGTLNDTPDAARKLWQRLRHPNLRSLWQPLPTLTRGEQEESLQVVLPHLSHIHVFQWLPGPPIERRPLAEGKEEWQHWMTMIKSAGHEIPALLEFVMDDDPHNLAAEAEMLREMLGQDV